MIYESQVRRSQAHPAGSTDQHNGQHNGSSGEPQSALNATLQPIEDALQRGVDFAKANPLLAVAGAAAVGALVVLASKKAVSRSDDTAVERMRHDLERFMARHRNDAAGLGQAVSSAFARVAEAEPETIAMLRKAGERMINRASDTLKSATGR